MAGSFEPQMAPFLSGTCTTQVHDTNLQPLNIVRLTDTWHVHAQWTMTGSIVPLIDGTWHVSVYAEAIGQGKDIEAATKLVAVESAPLIGLTRSYKEDFAIAPNPKLVEGLYRIVTVITVDHNNARGMVAAFDEGPILQFFQFP